VVLLINFFTYNLEVAQKGSVESSSTAPRREGRTCFSRGSAAFDQS